MKRLAIRMPTSCPVLLLPFLWLMACGPSTASSGSSGAGKAPPSPSPPASASSANEVPLAVTVAQSLTDGIDLSGHSGTVDWQQVRAAGHSFAFVKATEGVDLADPAFATHWPAMKAAGITRGAYHFYVTEDDPEAQAAFFTSKVPLEPGDLAPVVDLETLGHNTKPGLVDRFKVYLTALEAHYGVPPIIYTSAKFWDAHMNDQFGAYPLWVAEYEVDTPNIPIGWTTWHLWQWQGDAQVPGVTKTADLNRLGPSDADRTALVVPRKSARDAAQNSKRNPS